MAREPIPTWFFALAVVRQGRRFLAVHEREHGQSWSLPGGRVEPGEGFAAAALRETLEETGVPVVLEGILRVEHTVLPHGVARVRVIFAARPADDAPPKREADDDTLGAAWVTLEELATLPTRGDEVRRIFGAVADGAPVFPLSLLRAEGTPF